MNMVKKIIEKITKKVKKIAETEVVQDTAPEICEYNEYGTCIACQGGRTECLHTNLTTVGRDVVCVLCGFKVK